MFYFQLTLKRINIQLCNIQIQFQSFHVNICNISFYPFPNICLGSSGNIFQTFNATASSYWMAMIFQAASSLLFLSYIPKVQINRYSTVFMPVDKTASVVIHIFNIINCIIKKNFRMNKLTKIHW